MSVVRSRSCPLRDVRFDTIPPVAKGGRVCRKKRAEVRTAGIVYRQGLEIENGKFLFGASDWRGTAVAVLLTLRNEKLGRGKCCRARVRKKSKF